MVQRHPPLTPAERSLRGQIGAHDSWAVTTDRSARTAPARSAFENKFLAENDGDPQRAAAARKAYYLELAQKSAQARTRNREIKRAERQARIAALISAAAEPLDAA